MITEYINYRDGGSASIVIDNKMVYYIDGRLITDTRGEIFTEYPNEEGSEMITDMSVKMSIIKELEDYGRENAMYNVDFHVNLIKETMKPSVSTPKVGYVITNVHTEEVVVGYEVMSDGGDSQYLTADEFETFKRNRGEI